jgi:hypothetical protein
VIDLGDRNVVNGYGRDALDPPLLDDIAVTLAESPLDGFNGALEALDHAMLPLDAQRMHRSLGWIRRLLGDDIEAEARGEQLRDRMGVLLGDAQREAERVGDFIATLDLLAARLEGTIARLDNHLEAGEAWLVGRPAQSDAAGDSPEDRFRRRLAHLSTAAASYRITSQQLRLARQQAETILERHARIRDVLRPVWQQHRIATRPP